MYVQASVIQDATAAPLCKSGWLDTSTLRNRLAGIYRARLMEGPPHSRYMCDTTEEAGGRGSSCQPAADGQRTPTQQHCTVVIRWVVYAAFDPFANGHPLPVALQLLFSLTSLTVELSSSRCREVEHSRIPYAMHSVPRKELPSSYPFGCCAIGADVSEQAAWLRWTASDGQQSM